MDVQDYDVELISNSTRQHLPPTERVACTFSSAHRYRQRQNRCPSGLYLTPQGRPRC
ncbi:hypothetical protein J6590_042026 [Homalodisca vitripennis]|nr:hypothetical protein J6590_042026 [Homalodisca vitripennis]